MKRRNRKDQDTPGKFLGRHYFGKYRAQVDDNFDLENRGRLKVLVPNVFKDGPSVWALPCVPYAGPDVGMFFLPEKGTNVWVEFEGGNPNYPIWTGCFWKLNELAPGSLASKPFLKTKEFALEIDDMLGTLTITANAGGAKITLTRNQVQIEAAGDVSTTVGGRKTKLDIVKFDVNNGALEVV